MIFLLLELLTLNIAATRFLYTYSFGFVFDPSIFRSSVDNRSINLAATMIVTAGRMVAIGKTLVRPQAVAAAIAIIGANAPPEFARYNTEFANPLSALVDTSATNRADVGLFMPCTTPANNASMTRWVKFVANGRSSPMATSAEKVSITSLFAVIFLRIFPINSRTPKVDSPSGAPREAIREFEMLSCVLAKIGKEPLSYAHKYGDKHILFLQNRGDVLHIAYGFFPFRNL